eukprot:scaffold2007_cov123-Isochrysis_galbana.AAC.3
MLSVFCSHYEGRPLFAVGYCAPERRALIVGGGDCLGWLMKAVPRVPRGGSVCCCLQRRSASRLTGLSELLSLTASKNVGVLRLCSPSQRRTQQSTDLSHRLIGVVGCARLWHALACAVDRIAVVILWLSVRPHWVKSGGSLAHLVA